MTGPPFSRRELPGAALLSLSLALLTTFVSENLTDRLALRSEFIAAQFATLAGAPYVHDGVPTYYAPFQNRVLFPAVFAALTHLGILSDEGWYLALRTASAALLFLLCWIVFRKVTAAAPKQAAAGCILLAGALVFTFNFKWEHTSDYPDAIFTLLMLAATVTFNRPFLIAAALLGAANRESAAFAGVFWVCLHGFDTLHKVQWKEIIFGAALSIASYAAVIALRFAFGGPKAIGPGTQLVTFPDSLVWSVQYALSDPGLSSWPVLAFAMVVPMLLWIASNYRFFGVTQKRLLLAALLISLITTLFGYLNELRIFIPTIVSLVFVATWGEALASHRPLDSTVPMDS